MEEVHQQPELLGAFLDGVDTLVLGVDDEKSWNGRDKLDDEQDQGHGQAGHEGQPMLYQHGHLHQDGQ